MNIQIFGSILAAVSLVGCMNMPTPPAQITGSYASGLRYENFECARLVAEADSLARREGQLVVAQEQRVKSSQVQAFWWGFGQGDGVEASELANVRGEREAVRKAIETKGCHLAQARQSAGAPSPVSNAGSVVVGSPATSEIGRETGTVERLARQAACNADPQVRLTAKGPGFETYAVPCSSGDVVIYRCEFGNCRALK